MHLLALLPLLICCAAGLGLLMLEVFVKENPTLFSGLSLGAIAVAAAATLANWTANKAGFSIPLFGGAITVDAYSQFFTMLLLGSAGLTIIMGWKYMEREKMGHGEVYSLLMFALTGMLTLAMGTNLITLFVGVEVMSIAIYVLVGARRQSLKGNEAALKYFFLGAFSSGILLYGIALTYGMVGSVQLDAIKAFASHPDPAKLPLALVGLAMLLIGMGFKVAAAPFHAWTPDVYEGAPTPITGFMATAVKTASFAFFLRVLGVGFLPIKPMWVDVVAGLSVLTMFTGNLLAFVQTNIKRMLAYSSVAHTGYLMMGLVALSTAGGPGAQAILYYLVAYSLTNLGAFACITFLSKQNEKLVNIDDFAGVAKQYPGIALILGICFASLIGIPPTAGFFGKYALFTSVISGGYAWLAVVGIVNSILSVYYYLRPVVVMYMDEPKNDWKDAVGVAPARIAGWVCAVMLLWAGIGSVSLLDIVPGAQPILSWAQTSVASLF
jgi:NADH-quinone oxidoreductase subunit N